MKVQNLMAYWNPKADNIKGDIRDYHLLKDAMRDVDYVFHSCRV